MPVMTRRHISNQTGRRLLSHRAGAALVSLMMTVAACGHPAGPPLVRMSVEADVEVLHPGQTFNVVVRFTIEDQWHIYWINPGASGMPTDVRVELPPAFRVAPTRFPRPQSFPSPQGTTFGYEKSTALFLPVTAPAELENGTLRIPVAAAWLVCKGVCMLGSDEQEVVVRTRGTSGVRV